MSDIDLNALAAPIPRQYVKAREVGGGRKAAYITARTAMNRLDEVCGRENWRTEFRTVTVGDLTGVECTLYIRIQGEWVGKSDVGDSSKMDPLKGAYSDALKRAAAQWGVARELYGDGNVYETDDTPEAPTKSAPEAPAPSSELDDYLGPRAPRAEWNPATDTGVFDAGAWAKLNDWMTGNMPNIKASEHAVNALWLSLKEAADALCDTPVRQQSLHEVIEARSFARLYKAQFTIADVWGAIEAHYAKAA